MEYTEVRIEEAEEIEEGTKEETEEIEEETEEEETEKESWTEYFWRRMKEDGSYSMPNIAWYLAEDIFKEKGLPTIPYIPNGMLIKLPTPCFNIWAFKNPDHRLERFFGLSSKDLERVNYFACYIVTESKAGPEAGTVLTEKEYKEALEKYGNAFSVGNGTEGLLEYAEKAGKGVPGGVIRELPVIFPPAIAAGEGSTKERRLRADIRDDLSYFYINVLNQASRIKRLARLEAPEIIMRNEKRMLQEKLDRTIQNGLRGQELLARNNGPMFSLNDLIKEN